MTDEPTLIALSTSFDQFYRHEFPNLVAVATALLGSIETAEDLTQDTMVKSLMRWPRVQRLDRPGGWAHRVLLNACTSWWRRQRTVANHRARLRRVEPSVPGPSAEALAFWAAVRGLPERHRTVMALHYAGDRSVAEIAAIMGVPEGTIRSDLSRARAVLATELGVQ